jgi:AmmeMemoRadiSam system protein B
MWGWRRSGATVQVQSEPAKIRPPAVAGQFYPKDPQRLRATVAELLSGVGASAAAKALIAPHAGYVYSGPVAAHAFAGLRAPAQSIARVVLIGPAHYVPFAGIAVPSADAFATPLGPVPLDRQVIAALDDLPVVVTADAPHAPEHALEVELPFLQTLLSDFMLVPLLVGEADPQDVALVLRRLWGGPETLIVVSSDLSHYLDDATARRRDAATAAAIERADWAALGPQDACGFLAVAGLLLEAGRRGLAARRLALANSADSAGSPDRVVGYGAWALVEQAADLPG